MPTYQQSIKGGLESCSILASAAGIAEFPELIRESVLVSTKNSEGIYAFKIYIRGIPWVVSIDSNLAFKNPTNPQLLFAQIDPLNQVMWGPLFEKAWAKVKGSYATSANGLL